MPGCLYRCTILVINNRYPITEICSSVGFEMALGYLNKNSSFTIDDSQQPRVFVVSSLLSHIYSMKPCTKTSFASVFVSTFSQCNQRFLC